MLRWNDLNNFVKKDINSLSYATRSGLKISDFGRQNDCSDDYFSSKVRKLLLNNCSTLDSFIYGSYKFGLSCEIILCESSPKICIFHRVFFGKSSKFGVETSLVY